MKHFQSADMIGGLVLLIIGLTFFLTGLGYEFGSMRRLGPAGFPLIVSGGLCVLALILIVNSLRFVVVKIRKPDSRAVAGIFGAVLTFAALMPLAGLLPAAFATILVASFATPVTGLKAGLILATTGTFLCWIVFIVGLNLSVDAFKIG